MKGKRKGKISVLTDKDYQEYLNKLSGGEKLNIPDSSKDWVNKGTLLIVKTVSCVLFCYIFYLLLIKLIKRQFNLKKIVVIQNKICYNKKV